MIPSTFTAVGLDSSDSNGLAAWDDNDEEEDKGPVFMPAPNHSYLDLATLPLFLLPRKLLCAPITQPTTTTVPPPILFNHNIGPSSSASSTPTTPQQAALDWIEHDPIVGIMAGPAAERLHLADSNENADD